MPAKRTFKLLSVENGAAPKTNRYYTGTSPSTTAKKVFNNYCRNNKMKGACKKTFTIKETTQGGKHKEYTYQGTRSKLKSPKVIDLKNGSSYEIKYETKVKRVYDNPKPAAKRASKPKSRKPSKK